MKRYYYATKSENYQNTLIAKDDQEAIFKVTQIDGATHLYAEAEDRVFRTVWKPAQAA